jgi:hypothetical protein
MRDFDYLQLHENARKATKSITCLVFIGLLLYCTFHSYYNWMFFWAVLFIGEVIPSDIYPIKTFFAIRDELKKESSL